MRKKSKNKKEEIPKKCPICNGGVEYKLMDQFDIHSGYIVSTKRYDVVGCISCTWRLRLWKEK